MSDDVNKTRESLMRRKIENLTGELESLLASTNDLPNVNHLRLRALNALAELSAEKPPPPPPPKIEFSRPDHTERAVHNLDGMAFVMHEGEREEFLGKAQVHAILAVNETLREILEALR